MTICLFYHSLISDWNHGNAHFLRGVVSELLERGHTVRLFEPRHGWSLENLIRQHGPMAVHRFRRAFPHLRSEFYSPATLDLDEALDEADLVIVHEWNEPELVGRIGRHRRTGGYRLLFHDTHHRAVTAPRQMERYDLSHYDGVLAFGRVLRDLYLDRGWARRAWVWHEAADVRKFRPGPRDLNPGGDLVWIGNWGDDERTAELHEFLLEPARELELRARVYGVRYPLEVRRALRLAGIRYCGWLENHRAPQVFAQHRFTVHVPRRPYVEALPGIPTIRVFEALACGIPLICAPWDDVEGLFTPGRDYLLAHNGQEMKQHMRALLNQPELRRALAEHGRRTILSRHTCGHRVDELLETVSSCAEGTRPASALATAPASGASPWVTRASPLPMTSP